MSALRRRTALVLNPSTDVDFRRDVARAVAEGAGNPDALSDALRATYPSVVVRRRELSNEPLEVWYVYREGSWRPSATGQDARDDFRATSESLVVDAERVRDIEQQSAAMADADPELAALARESRALTEDMATKTAFQADLIDEARARDPAGNRSSERAAVTSPDDGSTAGQPA